MLSCYLRNLNMSGTIFCTGDFAPREPGFGVEFWDANFWAPNFGAEFWRRILLALCFPIKRAPLKIRAEKFTLHFCRDILLTTCRHRQSSICAELSEIIASNLRKFCTSFMWWMTFLRHAACNLRLRNAPLTNAPFSLLRLLLPLHRVLEGRAPRGRRILSSCLRSDPSLCSKMSFFCLKTCHTREAQPDVWLPRFSKNYAHPLSQQFLRFAITMPIADARNR